MPRLAFKGMQPIQALEAKPLRTPWQALVAPWETGHHVANLEQHEPTWANLGPSWGQLGINLDQLETNLGPTWGQLGPNLAQHGPT